MTEQDVESYLLLQDRLASQDPGDIDIRPNVESTVHQVFHRLLKRDKVKCRGKYKCNIYVFSRAYRTNFRRILKNEVETALCSVFSLLWPNGTAWGTQGRLFAPDPELIKSFPENVKTQNMYPPDLYK